MNATAARLVAWASLALAGTLAPAWAGEPARAVVVSQQAATVTLLDLVERKVSASIATPPVPAMLTASPDGRQLFVTHPDPGLVSVIDVPGGTVVRSFKAGKEPFGIAMAGADILLVSDWAGDALLRIDAATGEETGRAPVGRAPAHVVADAARGLAYVADRETDAVSIVEIASMRRVAQLAVGKAPFALALSPDGARLYVANVQSNDLSVIDTSTRREIIRIKAGLMPYGVALTPDGGLVTVSNQQSGTLTVIDAATLDVVGRARIGAFPEGVAVVSSRQALVADWAEDEVAVVDLAEPSLLSRIKVGAGPRAIILLTSH